MKIIKSDRLKEQHMVFLSGDPAASLLSINNGIVA